MTIRSGIRPAFGSSLRTQAFVLLLAVAALARLASWTQRVERSVAVEAALLARETEVLAAGAEEQARYAELRTAILGVATALFGSLAEWDRTPASRASSLATESGLTVLEAAAERPRTAGPGVAAIPLRLAIRGDLPSTLRFLAALEAGPELFHVLEIDFHPDQDYHRTGRGLIDTRMLLTAFGTESASGT